MNFAPPAPEVLEQLLSTFAHRHPEKVVIVVIDDGDQPRRLPFLLGNPTGACALPDGEEASPVWGEAVGAALKLGPGPAALELARDVVLWPPAPELAAWCARWSALPGRVVVAAREKYAGLYNLVERPRSDEAPPAPIAPLVTGRVAWRWLRPRGESYAVAITPPGAAPWRLFVDAINRPTADRWKLLRDLVTSCARGAARVTEEDAAGVELEKVIDQYPGLALLLFSAVSDLAGLGASVEVGEW